MSRRLDNQLSPWFDARHTTVRALWKSCSGRATDGDEDVVDVIKDAIMQTAAICHEVSREHPVDAKKRINFLFLSEKEGLAGWTKEGAL